MKLSELSYDEIDVYGGLIRPCMSKVGEFNLSDIAKNGSTKAVFRLFCDLAARGAIRDRADELTNKLAHFAMWVSPAPIMMSGMERSIISSQRCGEFAEHFHSAREALLVADAVSAKKCGLYRDMTIHDLARSAGRLSECFTALSRGNFKDAMDEISVLRARHPLDERIERDLRTFLISWAATL